MSYFNRLWIIAGFAVICSGASADVELLYGEDSREEVVLGDAATKAAAMSVVALIPKERLEQVAGGYRLVKSPTLASDGWCAGERFRDQTTASTCTGFFVGGDRIVTAAHCVVKRDDRRPLTDFMAVLSYALPSRLDSVSLGNWVFPEDAVYPLKNVVAYEALDSKKVDWALVSLGVNRRNELPSVPPVVLASTVPAVKDKLVLVGHPLGLPKKFATGTVLRADVDTYGYYLAAIDAFRGDSGAPVFVRRGGSLHLAGLVSSGGYDHDMQNGNCKQSGVCSDNGSADGRCAGEVIVPVARFRDRLTARGD